MRKVDNGEKKTKKKINRERKEKNGEKKNK